MDTKCSSTPLPIHSYPLLTAERLTKKRVSKSRRDSEALQAQTCRRWLEQTASLQHMQQLAASASPKEWFQHCKGLLTEFSFGVMTQEGFQQAIADGDQLMYVHSTQQPIVLAVWVLQGG